MTIIYWVCYLSSLSGNYENAGGAIKLTRDSVSYYLLSTGRVTQAITIRKSRAFILEDGTTMFIHDKRVEIFTRRERIVLKIKDVSDWSFIP